MKPLFVLVFACSVIACSTPNNSASTRVSTAPMSYDPSTTLPGTGAQPPAVTTTTNRIEPTTGTSPSPAALPDSNSGTSGADSTAHR